MCFCMIPRFTPHPPPIHHSSYTTPPTPPTSSPNHPAELPLDYNHAAQLCEVMFGQMLRTPLPVMRTMGYYTMMVDLCKLLDTFARSMSGCVKQLFARCATMYPELQRRWADWLAYHLTNFNFTWPWFRWAHVLQAPVYDPQRCVLFCVLCILLGCFFLSQHVTLCVVPPD